MAPLTSVSGETAGPLALGARSDHEPETVPRAAAAGVRFFFFYGAGSPGFVKALGRLAARRRERLIIGTGSGARSPRLLRAELEARLRALGTDYLDVFFAEYLRPDEDLGRVFDEGGTLDELARWQREGVVRYVGASAHDRDVSRRLAEDSRLDVLMQRYNMAHRKAAREVFPACVRNGVAVVAFTATRWATLLRGHDDWPRRPPSAGDCYRFCMAHPAIDITLTAPVDVAELDENLAAAAGPPMTDPELERWRAFGDLVYGDGTDRFETAWP